MPPLLLFFRWKVVQVGDFNMRTKGASSAMSSFRMAFTASIVEIWRVIDTVNRKPDQEIIESDVALSA